MKKRSKRRSRRRDKKVDKKLMNMVLKIGTITVAVLLAIFLGIYIPGQFSEIENETVMAKEYKPGEDIANSLKNNDELYKAENNTSGVENADDKYADETNTDKTNADETNADETNADETNADETNADETNTDETNTDETNADETNTDETNTDETNVSNEIDIPEGMTKEEEIQYVKDKWVDSMIHENRDSIDDDDLSSGASIYNLIDTNYIFGLAEDGLTDEEEAEVMEYLEANLSPEQIQLAKALFNKYIGLVD